MPLRSASRRAVADRLRLAPAALALALALALPGAAGAQPDEYKLHMERGVKLYADHNWSGARLEFRAAYDARPGANPLVNIALCFKETFRYPQAIAVLEEAIAKHGDAMSPADRKAAEDAIKEMRSLLGTLTLAVTPRGATIQVDGDELPPGAVDKPIPLGPDQHKILARADGYKTEEKSVEIRSGRSDALSIALVPEKGPVTDVPVPPTQPTPKYVPPLYVLGLGALLFPMTHATGWPKFQTDYGAGYGVRVGWQINQIAGFDAMYEHSSIDTETGVDPNAFYRVIANRVALGLRLISPGRFVRFAGGFGGGFVSDSIQFTYNSQKPNPSAVLSYCHPTPPTPTCPFGNGSGYDAFAMVEAGLEFDIERVLLDLSAQGEFQSTGNLATDKMGNTQSLSIFGAHPLVNIGPAVRFGYRFW